MRTTTVLWRRTAAAALAATLVLSGCGNTDSWVDAAPAPGWPAQYADAANSSYTPAAGAHELQLDWTRSVKGESLSAFLPDGSLLFTSKRDLLGKAGDKPSETTAALIFVPPMSRPIVAVICRSLRRRPAGARAPAGRGCAHPG